MDARLYLDLLKDALSGSAWTSYRPVTPSRATWKGRTFEPLRRLLDRRGLLLVKRHDPHVEGWSWPIDAYTMIGRRGLDLIERCVEQIAADHVPGDLLEAGVWRGGAAIYMRALLEAHRLDDRLVWVADSFRGLPHPSSAEDAGDENWAWSPLAVAADDVRANFARFRLLDDRTRFLEGWFRDTLPGPVEGLALLRVDGDLYESTMDVLHACHPLVEPGGFVIVDDYGNPELGCRKAVDDYRRAHRVEAPLERVDGSHEAFWRVGR
jgi:O-methyltransferase